MPTSDITGRVFAHPKLPVNLTVIGKAGRNKWRIQLWHCQCSCGGKRSAIICTKHDVTSGKVVSCKCLRPQRMKAVGRSNFRGGRKKRSKAAPKTEKICAHCGQPFAARPNQKYHPACQKTATAIRQKQRQAERQIMALTKIIEEKK